MDVNDIVNALEGILGLGDTLDSNGIGINTATGGEHTTREVLKTELGQFLMYVGAGGSSFSDGQVGLVNLLLSDQFGQLPAWRIKSVADDMTPSDPARNLSFIAFSAGDKAIAQQEGTPSKQLTDALINLYETFGTLMVAFNENAVSQSRCDSYVRSMRSLQSAGGLAAKTESAKPAKPTAQKQTASKSTAAKSSGKPKNSTKKTASKGSLAQFNDHISFALSGDYRMTWEKDNDGNDQCRIVSTKLSDSDNETPETTFVVSTPENENPDRDVFEFVQEGDDKSTFIPFNSDPEALMAVTNLDMQVLSMNFRTNIYRLLIRLSQTEVLQLFYTSTSSEGQNKMSDDIEKIIDLWRCLRIDGEAVDLGEADTAMSLVDYLREMQDNGGKPKKKEAASSKSSSSGSKAKKKGQEMIIRTKPAAFPDAEQYRGIHEVEGEPERVNPLGIWSIQVPPGCSYTMDPDYTTGSFTGKYPLQIQSTEDRNFDNAYDSRISFVVFAIGARSDAYSTLTDLSSDEATDEIVKLAAIADKHYGFFKHTGSLAIMIKDTTEKQDEYGAMFLIFTRGMQHVTNGQIVVRGKSKKAAKEEAEKILGSILPVEQPTGEAEYKPVVLPERYGLTYHDHKTIKLDGNITLPVPDGFKGSTDQKKIGAPRKFSIVPNDYSDFSKAMDAMIGITAVTVQGELPEYTPEICDEVLRQIKEQLEQHDVFVAEIPLVIAQKTTKGFICYQKALGKDTNKYITAKAIMLVGDAAYIISFALNFEDTIAYRYDVGIDAQMIISDWMNRIVLPGEKQYCISSGTEAPEDPEKPEWISNLISFPPPETLHEHFDLITGGGYTTHRDADFIGQSIRGLMEKCGSTDEEAYDDMQISVDKYDLDNTAIELAKVFRVDESKFDPYNDAEGLIRLGAFSHVRMFHALRSLSWMISRYTDWEDRSVKDISFEDLQAMGKLITKRNYLNYDGQTGYINLCNHYDWHVFYVPEKYMKSKYARNNDLRYLTGKENRGGNTMTFLMPGMGADQLRAMNRKNKLIGRNEETLESLEGLRKDLRALLPIMQTIHDGLLEGRDRSKKLDGPLADALTAWCALAIAAKEPFYSEEAADTPEADAALEEPLERPTDKLDDKPARKAKPEPKKDEKKETPKKSPAKQASKAGKAMKGASNDASYEQYLPKGTKLTPEETRYMTIIASLLTEKKKVNINDIAFETNETIEETKRVLSELRKKRVLGVTTYGNLEMWEPERRKKAATETVVPVSKKTGSRTETFYKRFTFELPDGYDLEREDDHRCVFYLNEHDDGTGTLVYDYLNTMTLENFTDLKPGESPVQRIRNSLYFTKDWYEISSEPETGILTEQGTFYKAGDPVDTYSMMYLYQLSDTEVLVFREKVMEGTKKDLSYHLDKYEHFLQAIGNICVDGKPVPAAGITAAELWDKVRAYRDVNYEEPGESRKKEEKKIKTKPAAKPEKIEKYNEMFGFAFPAGYEMRWETGEDGDRKCWIQYGSYYKDNGEKDYRFKALLSENQPADPLPGERPIQALKRINQDAIFSSVSTDPKAELMVKATPLNILGRIANLYAVWLIVEKNAREYFLVNCIGTWDEDREKQLEYYRCMIDVTNALRVNGKPLPQLTESPENLMRKMPPVFDEVTQTIRGNVNVEVSVNGKTVSSSTMYGDNAGNIHSRKRYTADMMPPGTDNPEKMAEELNDMDEDS